MAEVTGVDGGSENSNRVADPLLESLVILTKLHNRPYSAAALKAGLPLVEHRFTPELFIRSAERAGFKARIVKRAIKQISPLVLPVVLLLNNNQAYILHKINSDQTVEVIEPSSNTIRQKTFAELQSHATGYVIFLQPKLEYETRSATEKKATTPGSWFWGTFWRYRSIYAEVMLASLLINIFTIVSPLFIMNVYDRVVPNNVEVTLWVLSIAVAIIYLFDLILRALRGYFLDLCNKKADVLISSFLFEKVLGMQMANKPASVGGFVNNLREFETLRDFFTSATVVTIIDIPFSFIFLALIWYIGTYIVLVPLILMPLIILAAILVKKPLRGYVKEIVQGNAQKNAVLVESISGLETIKSLGAEGLMQQKWEKFVANSAQSGLRSRFLSSLISNLVYYAQQITTVATVIIGVYEIHARLLTLGGLIACNILSSRVSAPLAQLTNLLTRYEQAKEALRNLNSIAETPQERSTETHYVHRAKFDGNIEFNEVSFQYPNQKTMALDKLSLKIKAGEHVAIVGRIGSGKTTMQKLLLGFYTPQSGNIRIDDIDYAQIDPVDLRGNIGYVPQECLLFYGTVRDNIVMGMPWASDDAVIAAGRISGVDKFVNRNPFGYNLPVAERGEHLSGGQKQAVVIARAMIGNPPILFLDEPTSAMDNLSERELIDNIAHYAKDKTLIIATHNLALLPLVDRIIVLEAGRILMDGPKDKVLPALTPVKVNPDGQK